MRILDPTELTLVSGALDGAFYFMLYDSVRTPEELKRIRKELFVLDASVLGSTLGMLGAMHYLPVGVGSVLGLLVGGTLGYKSAEWVISMETSE